jgi:hypothetical protein
VFPARVALGLDVHSGYGQIDRLWFPFAKSRQPFPSLAEAAALKRLLDRTLPHHVYCIEPQSNHYLAHGDLWDYLYEEHRRQRPGGCFIPFTLEMGSWLWVKKNWSQAFSILGAFNPRRPHRIKRTLRRHLLLFDLFHRAVRSSDSWSTLDEPGRSRLHKQGLDLWFQQRNGLIGNLGKEN